MSCNCPVATAAPTWCRSAWDKPGPLTLNVCWPIPQSRSCFHYARFDIAVLFNTFGVMTTNLYCTKIASKLVRTYTDRHGLRDLCREMLGIDLSKQQQSSDWGSDDLSDAQVAYAASDVLHLHALRVKLDTLLLREGRADLAAECFAFLPTRARLDLQGWARERHLRSPILGCTGRRTEPDHLQGRRHNLAIAAVLA